METKDTPKKRAVKKAASTSESVVEEPPRAKPAAKKTTVKKKPTEAAPRAPRKAVAGKTVDPFEAIASSPVKKPGAVKKAAAPKSAAAKPAAAKVKTTAAGKKAATPKVEPSPVFKALAEPALPVLKRTNRARLQMQTPTRLFFYWSIKEDPWQLLTKAFGGNTAGSSLVLKLKNLTHGTEEIQPAGAEGDRWFDVDAGGEYEAEIGFLSTDRPYFRILHSNKAETPRLSPSPRAAAGSDWRMSADEFAEVLDVAGFTRDAFDVAIAGDDHAAAEHIAEIAFSSLVGKDGFQRGGIAGADLRHAMTALAAGTELSALRGRVSPRVLSLLEANRENLTAAKAKEALTEYFDVEDEITEQQLGSAVFGASLVNFPRTVKKRVLSAYSPIRSLHDRSSSR